MKIFIGPKKKKAIFICQIKENSLKAIKCIISNSSKRDFVGLEAEEIPTDIDDKKLAERIAVVFKKLEYNNYPVVISLPRNYATCRYIKVPAQTPQEIEKIVSLQASRYLPYPVNELITGYQTIFTDKESYSDVNLVIVHRDVIERYIKIFHELKVARFSIILSSWGLSNLYSYINPEDLGPVITVDIDSDNAELAIISNKKITFSRYFKLNRLQANWEDLFIDEINKTHDAYLKEVSLQAVHKIVILGVGNNPQELAGLLNRKTSLPIEVLSYTEKVNLCDAVLNDIINSKHSFVSLVGLGLADIEESLKLLPQDMKEKARRISQYKERLRTVLFIAGIVLIWFLALAKNLDNKAKYLERLKIELNKIAKEAKPLENIAERLNLLQSQSAKKTSTLDILYELHKILPTQVYLINFSYEEGSQIVVRGQTQELNSVFVFVSQLEKSAVFKKFNIKVRYATKKNTPAGEIVDFEIICAKK